MGGIILDVKGWAEQQFGLCQLGDKRRTWRLVEFAGQIAADPSGSTPRETETWGELKAAYRLLGRPEVTFAAITAPHYAATRREAPQCCLILMDTTELDFGRFRKVQGLGPTGNNGGQGFLLHSGLMVAPDGEVLGLAGQVIRYRKNVERESGGAKRLQRADRESAMWYELVEEIGPVPEASTWIAVCDRGGDQYELYCRMQQQGMDWVVRASQLQRTIETADGKRRPLVDYLKRLPVIGRYELKVTANNHQTARTAQMEVRVGRLKVPRPKNLSAWAQRHSPPEIEMWVVDTRETTTPQGVDPLHWVLYCSFPAESFKGGWMALEVYERRPTVEEFHKGIKTGCRVEERQYREAGRLEALTGIMSIEAVRLLQIRSAARREPERPAREVVPAKWIQLLQNLRRKPTRRDWTVREFHRELAKLGGFIGRKNDGEPGWITLWQGFYKLHLCLRGAEALQRKCG